jgi:chromosome segregation ATPase
MTDIAAIEARLGAALERISAAAERARRASPPADIPVPAPDEAEALRAELAAEKAAHGQLAERIKAIRAKQDETVAMLEARVGKLQARADALSADVDRLTRVNAALRAAARQLREAVAEAAPRAELVDQVMAAELDATRAAQSADRAELDAILRELTPLIEEKADG